jgi:hypothetical protein
MQCANLSDDELWRAIAQNTETMSALLHQQAELDKADSSAIHFRKRDLVVFANRFQRQYREYTAELRRRYSLG